MILRCSRGHTFDTSTFAAQLMNGNPQKDGRCPEVMSYDRMSGTVLCRRILKEQTTEQIMKQTTEQDKAEWEHPWPSDGEQCPECGHGIIETQEFGHTKSFVVVAYCTGLNGVKLEDADERDEDGCGCGWEGSYKPNGEEE